MCGRQRGIPTEGGRGVAQNGPKHKSRPDHKGREREPDSPIVG